MQTLGKGVWIEEVWSPGYQKRKIVRCDGIVLSNGDVMGDF